MIPHMPLSPSLRAKKRVVLTSRGIGIHSIVMFGRYNNASAEAGLEEHSHRDAVEICYLVRGRQTYYVGNESFHLRGGDVFLTLPDEKHGTGGGPQEKSLLYWIIFLNPAATGGSLLGLGKQESFALWRELKKTRRRHFHGTPEMKIQLDEILRLSQDEGNALKKTALRNRLVGYLLMVLEARERAAADPGAEYFAKVIRHIGSNLCDPDQLTVDLLSSVAGLSPSRFKALFKEKCGIPPAEYALRLRIDEARRRLAKGDASVTDVALGLGFSSSQYFASSFKRLTNMTPREAMKRS